MLARMRPEARHAAAEAVILLAFAAAAWLLYGSVLRLWWTHDDFHHFRFLLTHRPFWYFFDASAFREFSPKLLTPLLFFSLDVDRRLFGIHPHLFYVHHLLALSFCPAALYGILRLWHSRLWSAVGAWIFLIGLPTASLAPLLMVRHYIEAVALAALSVLAWAGALRLKPGSVAWRLAWLSAALYFAASMAKEIVVPLVLLLPFLPSPAGGGRMSIAERARLALPHAAALILYLALRFSILGTLLGTSGFTVTSSGLPALGRALPVKIAAELLGGRPSLSGAVFGAVLGAGILSLFFSRDRRAVTFTCAGLLLTLLPVLPVSTRFQPRYALPVWIVAAVAFAAGCRMLAAGESPARRRTAVALAVVACLTGLLLNRQSWSVHFAKVERMSTENRFFLAMGRGESLRQPLTLVASLKELAWMKENVFRRDPGGKWFQDDLYLCVHCGDLGRVWGWDAAARRVVDITARIPNLRARHCSSVRAASLRARFRFSGEDLFWNLGPYPTGTYRFVIGDGAEAFDMPRSAGFRVGWSGVLPLRVGYESPEGWITYSPEIRLHLVDGWRRRWSWNRTARASRAGIVRCRDGQPARTQGARR